MLSRNLIGLLDDESMSILVQNLSSVVPPSIGASLVKQKQKNRKLTKIQYPSKQKAAFNKLTYSITSIRAVLGAKSRLVYQIVFLLKNFNCQIKYNN